MTSPHKPTAALWTTVALVAVLVGYPLSLGPLNWLDLRQAAKIQTRVDSRCDSSALAT